MEENQSEVATKISTLFKKLKLAVRNLLKKIGVAFVTIGVKLGAIDPNQEFEITQSSSTQAEEVRDSTTETNPTKLAGAIVRHIEIDYDVINKDVTRSKEFKENLARVIEKSL